MAPRWIIVREYETIDVADTPEAQLGYSSKIISRSEADSLKVFQKTSGNNFFHIGHNRITATNWVGSIAIGNACIDVVPKIDHDEDKKQARSAMQNLLYMVSAAGLIQFKDVDISWLGKSDKPLIHAFLQLYIEGLWEEWSKGPIRRYVKEEANRFFFKGKLVVRNHLRENAFHLERFFTEADEFTIDNPLSQLLKAALTVCSRFELDPHSSTQMRTLLCLLDEVADQRDAAQHSNNVVLDRTTTRFKYLVNLAKCILQRVSPWRQTFPVPIYSLMFDMNEVFEKFIAEELRQASIGAAHTVRVQWAPVFLARKILGDHTARPAFRLRPDVIVMNKGCIENRFRCVIDTKWKKLKFSPITDSRSAQRELGWSAEPIAQTDMYQMVTYAHKYGCPVILVYPHHSKLEAGNEPIHRLVKYDCDLPNGPSLSIGVCTVNLTTLDLGNMRDRQALRESLLKLTEDL